MVMPMCGDGINDMFEAQPWNIEKYSEKCQKKWKVIPRPLMAPLIYGGKNISSSSNIVFSNGLLDPW
jgi:lysosomal Pro-X carboxypeptidase